MEYKIVFITLAICFLSAIESAVAAPLPSPATASAVKENMETWAVNFPRAASELEVWVTTYRDAARALCKWDALRPEQSKTFVSWVNTHQGKGIDVFAAQHMDWLRFNEIIRKHRPEIGAFIVWCRFHPKASTALMQHPRALHWVGRHLYESSLKVKDD